MASPIPGKRKKSPMNLGQPTGPKMEVDSFLSGPKLSVDPFPKQKLKTVRNTGGIAKAKTVNPVYNTY